MNVRVFATWQTAGIASAVDNTTGFNQEKKLQTLRSSYSELHSKPKVMTFANLKEDNHDRQG